MKKIFLILLAPLLMATQCESDDEPVFVTEYFIQNNSNFNLILITQEAGEILIESQSSQFVAKASNSNSFVFPSDNIAFYSIKLYKEDTNGNLIITYEQEPIVDDLWMLNTLSSNEVEYILSITDEVLN